MAARGQIPATHRKTGAALGYHGDVVQVTLRCHGCQTVQTEPIDACVPMRDQLAGITCMFCGRAGAMRMVKS